MTLQEIKEEVLRLSHADLQVFAKWFEGFETCQKRHLQFETFTLGMKQDMPAKSELADEMLDQNNGIRTPLD
jgi:hypothetical protein